MTTHSLIGSPVAALILAAGQSTRFGGEGLKTLMSLNGKPVVQWATEAFLRPDVGRIIVLAPNGQEDSFLFLRKLDPRIVVIPGGAHREESVWNGMTFLDGSHEFVLIHDGARPLVSSDIIDRVLERLRSDSLIAGVDTAVFSPSTLFRRNGEEVLQMEDRDQILVGQTPQGFRLCKLRECFDVLNQIYGISLWPFWFTDTIGVVKQHGLPCSWVAGSEKNIKITTPTDLTLAQALAVRDDPVEADLSELKDKSGLILGASGGIGGAIRSLAVAQGAMITAPSSEDFDVLYPEDFANLQESYDFIVYAPGILRMGRLEDLTVEQMDQLINVNLRGAMLLARRLPELLRPGGVLVLIGSSSSYRGRKGYAAYSATKAGLNNLGQALAEDYPEYRINVVNPARTNTPMRRKAFPGEDPATLLDPNDVAKIVLSLCVAPDSGRVVDVRVPVALRQEQPKRP